MTRPIELDQKIDNFAHAERHHRSDDAFAYRLGTAQMDEEELERNWIASPPLAVVFREPKDECDWDGVSIAT
jgi:hypothetical protein